MSQNVPKIGQNYILMTNRTKEAIIGQKWSKISQLDVPNMFELVPNGSNWPKMAKSKISNKVHLEKWRMGIVTWFKFVKIMYNLCKIT